MPTGPTNIFNALSGLSQKTQLQLQMLALSGDSPVSNAFTDEANRLGLTPEGRARKEREELRKFTAQMEAIRERAAEVHKQLDLLEQASMEALHENESRQREAREGLRRIRERAYEVTMPDGTTEKVYRDGEKVRTDAGAEVDGGIVRAEDLPGTSPSWQERKGAGDHVHRLEAEHRDIVDYQEKLARSKKALSSDALTMDQVAAIEADAGRMPESVRRHYGHELPARAAIELPGTRADAALTTSVSPTRSFNAALQPRISDAGPDDDVLKIPPSVSAPAPR